MNTQDIIEKLSGIDIYLIEDKVCLRFFALPEENREFYFDCDEVIIYEDFREYLEEDLEIAEEDLDELLDNDIQVVSCEGSLIGSFIEPNGVDWEGFEEAVELAKSMKVDDARDIIAAGLYLGVSLENIEEAYLGKYESDADYAEKDAEQLGDLSNLPDYIRNNIDWDGVAVALTTEFMEQDGYYFRNM